MRLKKSIINNQKYDIYVNINSIFNIGYCMSIK